MSYLTFPFIKLSPTSKTKVWQVAGISGVYLGEIRWLGKWRKYAFFPSTSTVFDTACLLEIAQFCNDKTTRHGRE